MCSGKWCTVNTNLAVIEGKPEKLLTNGNPRKLVQKPRMTTLQDQQNGVEQENDTVWVGNTNKFCN